MFRLKIFSIVLLLQSAPITFAAETQLEKLAGFWVATTYYDDGVYSGEQETARLEIKVTKEEIIAISTTGARLNGFFDAGKGILSMRYRRGEVRGEVILWLSGDAKTLEGKWSSQSGDSGRYIAVKE